MSEPKLLHCSFCGKSQHQVRKLIAGPTVFICDECVDLCDDIIAEDGGRKFRSTYSRRMTALRMACEHRDPHEASEGIVERARAFEAFLLSEVDPSPCETSRGLEVTA